MWSRFHLSTFLLDSTLVALALIGSAFLAVAIATNGRIESQTALVTLSAIVCCAVIYLPGIALRNWKFSHANRYLMALAWRLPTSFAVLLVVFYWDGLLRKYFVAALLTCYFVALVLESGLQIGQVKRQSVG